jgi:hypothetical protein
MVQVIQLGTEIVDPALEPWKDFAGRWQSWRSRFNRHHWPESWQGQAYQADRLVFPSPWDDEDLITRFSLRQGLLFGYVIQQNKRRALLLPGYLGAGHELEAIYLIQEQVLLHFPCSLAGSDWFLQVINVLLPELLSRPAVPPELVQAPLQLRIEGHPNFAHCLLNTYTCLEDFLPEINTRLQVVGAQPFGPIDALFPECQWVLSPAGHEREEIEFELPLSHRPNQINHSLRRRIQGFAEKCSTGNHEDFEECLTTWKSNGGWILWVSLKTRGAVAHGLEEFIAQLLKELAFRQCAPLLLLDGFSYQSGDTSEDIYYGLSIQELLVEELEQANAIRKLIQVEGCKIEIIEAIGLPLLKSIKLASFADFYVCHQGTVQHKIGWTCWDTPGVVHSNLTRWRSGEHEWGGMGGRSPIWLQNEAISEYQQAPSSIQSDSFDPRRSYQINCQPAIVSVLEELGEVSLIPMHDQIMSILTDDSESESMPLSCLVHGGFFQEAEDQISKQLQIEPKVSDSYQALLASIFFRQAGDQVKAQSMLKMHSGLEALEFDFAHNYLQSLLCQPNLQEALFFAGASSRSVENGSIWSRAQIDRFKAVVNSLSLIGDSFDVAEGCSLEQATYIESSTGRQWNNPSVIDRSNRYSKVVEAVYCPLSRAWYDAKTGVVVRELLQPIYDYTGFYGGLNPHLSVNIDHLLRDADHLEEPSSFLVPTGHFGHFLTQAASYAGALVLPIEDNLGLSSLPRICLTNGSLHQWSKDILATGAQCDLQFRELSSSRPLLAKQLIVARQSWIEWNYCHESHPLIFRESARKVLDGTRSAAAIPSSSKNYYFSRSKITNGLRYSVNEISLEEQLVKRGFEVIYPELVPPAELYAIMNNAKVIAGSMGSAMHNILFRTSDSPLVTLNFAHFLPPLNFAMIEACCGVRENIYSRSCEEISTGDGRQLLYFDIVACMGAIDRVLDIA